MKALRLLLSCICIFSSSTIYAYDFEENGLYYEFIPNEFHCVAMCGIENNVLPESYHGNLTLPETVTYYGIKYNVTGIKDIENVRNITTLTIHSKIKTLPMFSFPGSLKEFVVDEDNEFCCSIGIYNDKFWHCNEYFDADAFRSYFALAGTGPNTLSLVVGDGVTTGIEGVSTNKIEGYYDLSGKRLDSLQKGVNIVKTQTGVRYKVIVE